MEEIQVYEVPVEEIQIMPVDPLSGMMFAGEIMRRVVSSRDDLVGLVDEWRSADQAIIALERAYPMLMPAQQPAVWEMLVEARKARDVIEADLWAGVRGLIS